MTITEQIKHTLQTLYTLLDTVEENGGKPEGVCTSLKNAFRTELHTYLMYLSGADGKVSAEESVFMNYLFDMNLSEADYARFIRENSIYSTDYENRVPITLQIVTEFDKKAQILSNLSGKSIDPISPIFLKFYADVGKAFIFCDGLEQNEVDEYQVYLNGIIEKLSARIPG